MMKVEDTNNGKDKGPEGGDQNDGEESMDISWEDIKMVQALIERCLQQYLTQTEIITALQLQANIDPSFTCLVWQKLEEQNPDFFYAYNIRLRVKDQIVAFNYLVDQQVALLQNVLTPGAGAAAAAAAAGGGGVPGLGGEEPGPGAGESALDFRVGGGPSANDILASMTLRAAAGGGAGAPASSSLHL